MSALATEDKKDYMYMKVTKDEFELPLAIANSVSELAEKVGVQRSTVHRALNKKHSGYVSVEMDRYNEIGFIEEAIMTRITSFSFLARLEFDENGKSGEWAHLMGIAQGLRIALFQCIKAKGE